MNKEKIDRSGWPRGPWDNEPDFKRWIDGPTGFDCAIKRIVARGHLCGYVGISPDHPWFKVGSADGCTLPKCTQCGLTPCKETYCEHSPSSLLDVHGGVTYSDDSYGDDPAGLWWFGFDCAHLGDLIPEEYPLPRPYTDYECDYKNMAFVKAEVKKLAKQLHGRGL